MKRYQTGDQVWWAHYGMRQIKLDCPVCFGKLKVMLILGNGDQISLPCDYCGKGFDGPLGYVMEYQYMADAELVMINEVRTHSSLYKEDVIEYLSGLPGHEHFLYPEDIFDTKGEAVARSLEKSQEEIINRETQIEHIKKNVHKSFSWNAGYHMREVKKALESAKYHERMASICKSRSKSEPKSVKE